jgi:hypothetical protein
LFLLNRQASRLFASRCVCFKRFSLRGSLIIIRSYGFLTETDFLVTIIGFFLCSAFISCLSAEIN